MNGQNRFIIKIADQEMEFDLIHALNYQTFVEEIPQHPKNERERLVDKFNDENTYIICLDGEKLAGAIAIRGNRPFSLDEKINNLDAYLEGYKSICEIRLLMVDKEYRKGNVFYYLAEELVRFCYKMKYDCALMSGTTRQLKLYKHIGFTPFYHLIGREGAFFQPMYITAEKLAQGIGRLFRRRKVLDELVKQKQVNLLPGPVEIHTEVKKEYEKAAVSHRGDMFLQDFRGTQNILCEFVNAKKVELFTGSGTLANEVIAAQLSTLHQKGLILAAGEFGERLIKIAGRWGLDFQILQKKWGEAFTDWEIKDFLDREGQECSWLWTVHCESSTGVLTDLDGLKVLCQGRGIKLCLDAISTIAAIPLDLSHVYLASGTSGKAIGSFAGIAMVFYNHEIRPSQQIPMYLDLGYYHQKNGVPFTISSNLIYALKKAIEWVIEEDKIERINYISSLIKKQLKLSRLNPIVHGEGSSPAIITCSLPPGISSKSFGEIMEGNGYLLSYKSSYLIERNWIQVCIMGEVKPESIVDFRITIEESLKEAERKALLWSSETAILNVAQI